MKKTLAAAFIIIVSAVTLFVHYTAGGTDGNPRIVSGQTALGELVRNSHIPNRDPRGDPVDAAEKLIAAASREPADEAAGEAYYMAGVLYSQAAEWEEALNAYCTAIEDFSLSPLQEVSALLSMSQCKRHVGDAAGALDCLREMHTKSANTSDLYSAAAEGIAQSESAYFNTLYALLASSFLEATDIFMEIGDQAQAADNLLSFLKWYDQIHPRKVFYEADRDLGLDCSAPLIDAAARLYMDVPGGGTEKALEIYSKYGKHWTATPDERFMYKVWSIELGTKPHTEKMELLRNLIDHYPESEMAPQAKERLAHYARVNDNIELAMRIWEELADLKGKRRARFYTIVQTASLHLAYYHLRENDADKGQKYLDRIAFEFPGTHVYNTATRMGLWKWPEEIRSRVN